MEEDRKYCAYHSRLEPVSEFSINKRTGKPYSYCRDGANLKRKSKRKMEKQNNLDDTKVTSTIIHDLIAKHEKIKPDIKKAIEFKKNILPGIIKEKKKNNDLMY